jgi:hypothetical protein
MNLLLNTSKKMQYNWANNIWEKLSIYQKKDGWYWFGEFGEVGPYTTKADVSYAQLNYITIVLDPPRRTLICA